MTLSRTLVGSPCGFDCAWARRHSVHLQRRLPRSTNHQQPKHRISCDPSSPFPVASLCNYDRFLVRRSGVFLGPGFTFEKCCRKRFLEALKYVYRVLSVMRERSEADAHVCHSTLDLGDTAVHVTTRCGAGLESCAAHVLCDVTTAVRCA